MIAGEVGTDPSISYTVSPTGGVIVLETASKTDYGSWTLTRFLSVSGVNVSGVVLQQGVSGDSPLQVFVDIGDETNLPLDPTQLYVYQLATASGTVATPALSPACAITVEQDQANDILFRALQSGIAALKLPASFRNAPQVIHAMPLAGNGIPIIPSISFTETLLQEQEYRIGEDVNTDNQANQYQVASQALRHFTVFIMASNVTEREYYKDAVIGIFNSMLGTILDKIGLNITHRFQATSTQIVGRMNEPGFFLAEILLEFTGLYSTGITTSYGVVNQFGFTFNETQSTIMVT